MRLVDWALRQGHLDETALTDAVFYRVMTQSFYFFTVLGLALRLAWLRHAETRRASAA